MHWFSRPASAIALALAAVSLFTVVLGLAFLPAEAKRLRTPDYVSVTHYLAPQGSRPGVSLFWNISLLTSAGCRHRVAMHPLNSAPAYLPLGHLAFTPLSLARGSDENHIFLGSWDGTICSVDLRQPSTRPVVIGRHPDGGVVAMAWSESARCVLSQSAFHLYAWDLGAKTERWRRTDVAPYCFATRPDAPAAIVSGPKGELVEIDLRDGRTVRTLAHYEQPALVVSISPRGDEIAVLQADGRFRLLDRQSCHSRWDENRQRVCQTAAGRFAAFSPCGTMVVTAGCDSGKVLTVWNVATGQQICELDGHDKVINGAAFSVDGVLHSWSADGTIRKWDLRTGAMQQIASLAPLSKAG